jgi:hypothetical protein
MTETEKAIAEVWALFRETREQITQLTEIVRALTDKWGKFVEYILAPGIPVVFQKRGIPIHTTFQRVKRNLNGENIEIDILGVNEEYVLLVEVKSTLGVDGVKQHLKNIAKFKRFFPEYASKKIIGAVAGIEITSDADDFAVSQGFFVLGQSGEAVTLLNDEKFKPREW